MFLPDFFVCHCLLFIPTINVSPYFVEVLSPIKMITVMFSFIEKKNKVYF